MHSGAELEAFTAALNRDIEGDTFSLSQPSDSGTGIDSQYPRRFKKTTFLSMRSVCNKVSFILCFFEYEAKKRRKIIVQFLC